MNKVQVTDMQALILWDSVDAVVGAGAIKNPGALDDIVAIRKSLARVRFVKAQLAARAKAAAAKESGGN